MTLLLQVLREPTRARGLSIPEWNLLMQQVRSQRLCARLSWLLEDQDLQHACPEPIWDELFAQRCYAEFMQTRIRLELRKLRKALVGVETDIVLLKGAAYAAGGLKLARGRRFADLDILLPRNRLEAAETALEAHGWLSETTQAYDQRYYRRWMHELPPLRHPSRGIELDVHHNILPLTSRLKPDASLLWAESTPLPMAPFRILCRQDLVLHSATHLFHDGEIAGELGNLLDIHQLLTQFGQDRDFWDGLLQRTRALGLGRPLHYALEGSHRFFGTPIPGQTLTDAKRFAPDAITWRLMHALISRVLEPRYPLRRPAHFSAWLLYVRSHWLRMPPGMLALHLARKAMRRRGSSPA